MNPFDPVDDTLGGTGGTLSTWLKQFEGDPNVAYLMATDPSAAIDHFVKNGIEPPSSAMAYSSPGFVNPGETFEPPSPVAPSDSTTASIPLPQARPTDVSASQKEPTPASESVPLPKPRPEEAPKADDSDEEEAQKKRGGDSLTKALAAVKALQPPAPAPVGTPGAPHPNALAGTNIQQLLQLMGQQSRPSPVATLGQLLVQGKA